MEGISEFIYISKITMIRQPLPELFPSKRMVQLRTRGRIAVEFREYLPIGYMLNSKPNISLFLSSIWHIFE